MFLLGFEFELQKYEKKLEVRSLSADRQVRSLPAGPKEKGPVIS